MEGRSGSDTQDAAAEGCWGREEGIAAGCRTILVASIGWYCLRSPECLDQVFHLH